MLQLSLIEIYTYSARKKSITIYSMNSKQLSQPALKKDIISLTLKTKSNVLSNQLMLKTVHGSLL